MNNNKVFFIIIFLIILAFFFYTHENIHKQIYESDGCNNVKIGFSFKGYFYTECISSAYTPSDIAALSNNINEVIGYNMEVVLLLIFIFRLSKEE